MRTILKVQVPLETDEEQPAYLVYNEDRSFHAFLAIGKNPKFDVVMKDLGVPKAFFDVDIVNGQVQFIDVVEDPGW